MEKLPAELSNEALIAKCADVPAPYAPYVSELAKRLTQRMPAAERARRERVNEIILSLLQGGAYGPSPDPTILRRDAEAIEAATT